MGKKYFQDRQGSTDPKYFFFPHVGVELKSLTFFIDPQPWKAGLVESIQCTEIPGTPYSPYNCGQNKVPVKDRYCYCLKGFSFPYPGP